MTRYFSLFFVALLFSLTANLRAQTASSSPSPTPVTTGTGVNSGIWKCVLPGGTYEVAIRSITSVSTSEYIVNGAAQVTELNIDTTGNSLVRFYYIEPISNRATGEAQSLIDKAKELADQATNYTGVDAWKNVQKNYPTSTHAHTVEYRLDSIDELNQLFTSADAAFTKGKPATIVISAPTGDSSNPSSP